MRPMGRSPVRRRRTLGECGAQKLYYMYEYYVVREFSTIRCYRGAGLRSIETGSA